MYRKTTAQLTKNKPHLYIILELGGIVPVPLVSAPAMPWDCEIIHEHPLVSSITTLHILSSSNTSHSLPLSFTF